MKLHPIPGHPGLFRDETGQIYNVNSFHETHVEGHFNLEPGQDEAVVAGVIEPWMFVPTKIALTLGTRTTDPEAFLRTARVVLFSERLEPIADLPAFIVLPRYELSKSMRCSLQRYEHWRVQVRRPRSAGYIDGTVAVIGMGR